ncbi:hypothetical protein TPY_2538 [Sulfobacillus acidophilus TPY]|nr:hypothetical protein TPY_2538 [Sulfobacillus acidophilus TPY]
MPRKRQLADGVSAEGTDGACARFESGPFRRTPHTGKIPLY